MDDDYIRALSYGMPPTAGEGIGTTTVCSPSISSGVIPSGVRSTTYLARKGPICTTSPGSSDRSPVLAPLTPAAIFLVATIDEGGEPTVHDALTEISGLVRAIGFRDPGFEPPAGLISRRVSISARS